MKKVAIGPRVQPKVHEDGSVVGLQKLLKKGDFEWAPYVESEYRSAEEIANDATEQNQTDQGDLLGSIEMLKKQEAKSKYAKDFMTNYDQRIKDGHKGKINPLEAGLTFEDREAAIKEYKSKLPPFHLDNLKFALTKVNQTERCLLNFLFADLKM